MAPDPSARVLLKVIAALVTTSGFASAQTTPAPPSPPAALAPAPEPMPLRNQLEPHPPREQTLVPPGPIAAPPSPQQKRFGDWSTTRHENPGQIVCFALAKPRGAKPQSQAGAEAALVYVTSWPQAGIKAEVSVLAGQPFAARGVAQLAVGSETFTLATQGNRGFIANPIQELKLLEAMKRGSQMTLTARSGDGDGDSDSPAVTFSLVGLAQALGHVTQGCP